MHNLVEKAERYATWSHGDQLRKYTGAAYIEHPREVAAIVAAAGLSHFAVCAAWLHDVVEDCGATILEINHLFGAEVARMVWDLTDTPPMHDLNRVKRKYLDRVRIGIASMETQSIKAADMISNTPSIVDHDREFAKVYLPENRSMLTVLQRADVNILARAETALRDAERKLYGPLAALV